MSKAYEESNRANKQLQKSYSEKDNHEENESSIYLMLRDKIYPGHLNSIKKYSSISTKLTFDDGIYILNMEAGNQVLQNVLKISFKGKIAIPPGTGTKNLMKVTENSYNTELQMEIYTNIGKSSDPYEIFIIYKIKNDLKIQQINPELNFEVEERLQQGLNFSIEQLIQFGRETFIKISREYKDLQLRNIYVGLTKQEVQQLTKKEEAQIIQQEQIKDQSPMSIKKQNQFLSLNNNLHKIVFSPNIENSGEFSSNNSSSDLPDLYENKIFCTMHSQNRGETQKENFRQTKDDFLELECVASPVVDLEEVGWKIGSFASWTENQDNRFMVIQNDNDCEEIAERSSQQEDFASDNEEEQQTKKQKNKSDFPVLPQINKHFIV